MTAEQPYPNQPNSQGERRVLASAKQFEDWRRSQDSENDNVSLAAHKGRGQGFQTQNTPHKKGCAHNQPQNSADVVSGQQCEKEHKTPQRSGGENEP